MEWTRGHTIGHGSSATVSMAVSRISGDVFAVKSAELARSEPLRREKEFLSTLDSPHVVGYMGCDVTLENGRAMFNLMIEHAPDGAVSDAVRHDGRLPESAIRRYTRGVLKGLEYLLDKGIVHCDIKGSNVLISGGEAKIADFGCAKAAEEEAVVGGTPLFMAPEVLRGEEQGFAADIWALGCTVIEMATGRTPWPNTAATLHRIAFSGEAPELPDSLSESGKDFLSKCLKVDWRERWTAKELLQHPFVDNFRHDTKIVESTDSPTSILDRGIWSSMEEEFSHDRDEMNFVEFSKFKELCVNSRMEELDWADSWVTVRDS